MNKTGVIYGINGPVVYLKGNTGFKMSEMVYVGEERLVGEVIGLTKDTTTIQVFEETTGLKPGAVVEASVRSFVRKMKCCIESKPLLPQGPSRDTHSIDFCVTQRSSFFYSYFFILPLDYF